MLTTPVSKSKIRQGPAARSLTPVASCQNESDWERMWAPYDETTYHAALDFIHGDDFVLEIGAGDLRFARQVAAKARRVEAVEIQTALIVNSLQEPIPDNLIVRIGDARIIEFPPGVSAAVLLMRHCTHFHLYVEKLRRVGCQRLITNARWRMGVESVDLYAGRLSYLDLEIGWYACDCGAVGFKPGQVEKITLELDRCVDEVSNCPNCQAMDIQTISR